MKSLYRTSLLFLLGSGLALSACTDDVSEADSGSASGTATETGDGDGDSTETAETGTASASGDGDGDMTGDGDGDPATGDGDGDTGDGDGDTGDGDGDTGDGDGDTGDGDGDTGDGDGDTGDGDGDTGDGDGDTGDGDGDTGDGDGDPGACAEGCGNPGCGDCPEGPAPVDVGAFEIDSTEVTNSQYQQFMDVGFGQSFFDGLPQGCEFKVDSDDFIPDNFPVDPPADLPIVGIDWCDAYAYCEWSGKELCGAIGGGPADPADVGDFNASQWYRACTQAGIKEYPYGLLYQPTACNTTDAGFDQLVDVGSLVDCEGGYPGIYDMSGNAWEWTNSCNDQDECRRRGGSYFSDANTTRCFIDSMRPRDFRNNNQGFRCCNTQ